MSDESTPSTNVSPALVALAAWVIPGSGYLLIRQWPRGITIGISILALFFFGLLIGGIRCLDVPGYDAHGHKLYSFYEQGKGFVERTTEPDSSTNNGGWIMTKDPVSEIRSKPWSIAQIMMGPLDLLCDWWAISVSPANPNIQPGAAAARSHSRVNELGVLYTAVAGMLNLLAIIDSSHRASQGESA